MKLVVNQRCEQGTPKGVMKFNPGEYAVEQKGDDFTVTHEARDESRKVVEGDNKVRKIFKVKQTVVTKAILDKMVAAGVAKVEG